MFIRRTRLRNALWPFFGLSAFLLVVFAWAFLATHHPMLGNPVFALDELAMGRVKPDVLIVLAAAAPVTVSLIFLVLLCFIVVLFGHWLDKRRLLKILLEFDTELNNAAPKKGTGSHQADKTHSLK